MRKENYPIASIELIYWDAETTESDERFGLVGWDLNDGGKEIYTIDDLDSYLQELKEDLVKALPITDNPQTLKDYLQELVEKAEE